MTKKSSTYYKEIVPKLIDKYKRLVETCFEIADEPIDIELSSDKRYNELRSKRDAMTDAQFYAKQIDLLENEMNGVTETEEEQTKEPVNLAKKYAKKPN